MNASVPALGAIIGVFVLLFGRRLFWLCVAAVGFAAGVELAPHLVQEPTAVLQLSIAIVLGFVGALLALLLQKVAVGIVGFAAGGRLAVGIAASFFVAYADYYWLTFIIGGVLGALLLLALFDWALISSSARLCCRKAAPPSCSSCWRRSEWPCRRPSSAADSPPWLNFPAAAARAQPDAARSR